MWNFLFVFQIGLYKNGEESFHATGFEATRDSPIA